MKGSRALGLIAASATASLPLLASFPLGAAAASAPAAASVASQGVHSSAATSLVAAAARHRLVGSAKVKQARLLFAAGIKPAKRVTAAWLPKGCKLVEIGPANVGYTKAQMCPLPKGFRLRHGYMLVRGSLKPAVHTSSGASG